MKTLKSNNHVCVNASNKDLAWAVNQQQQGLTGVFDHTMQDVDIECVDFESTIKNWIDLQNAGEVQEINIVESKLINERGFYEDENGNLWLAIGTMADLEKELEQEIEYQKNNKD